MELVPVQIAWLDAERCGDLKLPSYASRQAAGMDVAAALEVPLTLQPGDIQLIPTGFAVAIADGYEIRSDRGPGWQLSME
jgi:dUTP pyrophosphatase